MSVGNRRRLAGWLTAAALAVAACSSGTDDRDPRASEQPTTSTGQPADDAGATSTPGDTAPPADGAPSPPDGAAPPAAELPSPPGGSAIPPDVSDAPAPAPAGVGAYAPFYLRPDDSSTIRVDIRSQSGAEPSGATVDHVRGVLGRVSGKQVRTGGGSIGGGARQWSPDDIRALADSAGVPQTRDASVIRLLYLRGGYTGGDTVLGVAVRSDVAAIFADRIDEAAGPLGNRARIEDAITIHEVGHLLGLVDLFVDRGRADPDHPGHSPNRGSVMYYAVESTLVGSILSGGPPTEFDADDLAELAAIRDGRAE